MRQTHKVQQQYDYVNTFLNSIGRNSYNSKKTYNTGLTHFANFLQQNNQQIPNTIIPLLIQEKINVYELLDQFVAYLLLRHIAVPSIRLYIAAVRSFIEYFDVDISHSKFKRRVKMPKYYPDPEEPLTIADIRELLNQCRNERLACFLLLLISTGMRVTEAVSLRLKDIDFSISPTRITVRKETTKTKRGRVVYCSDEATKQLRILMEQQQQPLRNHTAVKQPNDFIFAIQSNAKPRSIYLRLLQQFERLQRKVHKDQKKENSRRRKITLHSFRRTAFSIINGQSDNEYANWFIGHNHSVYWTHTENERRYIYAEKCMAYLTVLDYSSLDARSKNIEIALKEKDQAIQHLTIQMKEMQEYQNEMRVLLQNPKKLIEMLQENMS